MNQNPESVIITIPMSFIDDLRNNLLDIEASQCLLINCLRTLDPDENNNENIARFVNTLNYKLQALTESLDPIYFLKKS